MKNTKDKTKQNNDQNKLSFGSALKKNVRLFNYIINKIVRTKYNIPSEVLHKK